MKFLLLFVVLSLHLFTATSIAGVANTELNIKGISWGDTQLNCEGESLIGKMYLTEGAAASYAFSDLLAVCHLSDHKNQSKWLIKSLSTDSVITGQHIEKENIQRYSGYPTYVLGKDCRFTVDDGWRCDSYTLLKKIRLDVHREGESKMLSEPSEYSVCKLADDMLDEKSLAGEKKPSKTSQKSDSKPPRLNGLSDIGGFYGDAKEDWSLSLDESSGFFMIHSKKGETIDTFEADHIEQLSETHYKIHVDGHGNDGGLAWGLRYNEKSKWYDLEVRMYNAKNDEWEDLVFKGKKM